MAQQNSKELEALLNATRKYVEDEFDNSYGGLMGLYEAHRDYVEDGDGDVLYDLIEAVETTIEQDEFESGIVNLLVAYEDYKASL